MPGGGVALDAAATSAWAPDGISSAAAASNSGVNGCCIGNVMGAAGRRLRMDLGEPNCVTNPYFSVSAGSQADRPRSAGSASGYFSGVSGICARMIGAITRHDFRLPWRNPA
ncbi:hypothetical protein D3C73_1464340 [compost metagenome]